MLGDKRSGNLEKSQKEVEAHLRETHSDPERERDLPAQEKLISPANPTEAFDESQPRLTEFNDVLKRARAASAPGPNGIPYRVYKNCPKLQHRLFQIIRVVWRKGRMAKCWLTSEGIFAPKEENSSEIGQFRTISLLNVEGKIFLSILAKRLTNFLLRNGYIDTSVQKGGIPGVSGCIEHTSVITQIIKEARQNKGELAVIWLDLANAYGTIPHKLVDLTLARYHVPEKFRSLIQDYYARFNMRFTVNGYTTALQRLEIGIITGCTISVIIFAAAVNLLLKSVENQGRGAISRTGTVQPPTRAFMDDMTVMTRTIQQGRWTLNDLNDIFTWARMRFKPVKSRSLVIKKGRPKKVIFTISGVQIPTVEEKPIKCLGKWYNITGSDKENVEQMVSQAEKWLQEVDKSGLPGTYKAWSYQHGILPRLTWPMFIYDIPITTIEKLERRISSYLRRWLNFLVC